MADTLRVAVVGAGPAGFYAAEKLLKAAGDELTVEVELFDRVPTPWGLVRSGVAPDHPKIKSVSRVYEKTAQLEGFHFHGNVEVGGHVSHDELLAHHHAVLYSYGASADRRLGIPGEDLPGSWAATDFVAWYNGHPDAPDLEFDLSCRRAVVVGNGNVALDIARMLVLGHDELSETDTADHALDVLEQSSIEEVVVLGRRGPAQAAYTTPELKELGEMTDADVLVDPADVELDEHSCAWLAGEDAGNADRKKVEIVEQYAQRSQAGKRKRVVLRFLASPVEILGERCVEGVRVARNELVADEQGRLRARQTDDVFELDCGLLLRSIGYKGAGIAGIPFDDESGTIPNDAGRVLDPDSGERLQGVYAAGWIKRGPTGVIGTNKKCAGETVASLLEDFSAGRLAAPAAGHEELDELLSERQPEHVDYEGWRLIDEYEQQQGSDQGRPRVKLVRMAELVERSVAEGAASER